MSVKRAYTCPWLEGVGFQNDYSLYYYEDN
jgi:hypothetical protein